MALSYKRTRLDRRFGFVLIAVFALGILGGTLATAMNGGQVPDTQTTTLHLIKMTAPL
jgi:hypothetical protein